MPKCLECGFEAPRLQWTHFKYKCTGRFQNGTEYQRAYPGAELVDPDLKKKTAVTEENLIKKYGASEGSERWKQYREKQARTNSFEYKKEKYGWTEEDFQEYNKSRAVTLENCVKRHGEEAGVALWNEYRERQAYTCTLEYFIGRYGEASGRKKYENFVQNRNGFSVDAIQRVMGCSKEEAQDILIDRLSASMYSSNLEKRFVKELERQLGEKLKHTCQTKQYGVWAEDRIFFFDIVHNNRAIEVFGDYWHMNPMMYDCEDIHVHSGRKAEEVWAHDLRKTQLLLEKRSIPTLIVWESEIKENLIECIKRSIRWIQHGPE